MKKWGVIVTLLYAVLVMVLLFPVMTLLTLSTTPTSSDYIEFLRSWGMWLICGIFVLSQFSLLSLTVDTSQKRTQSRTPIVRTALITGVFLAAVIVLVVLCVLLVVMGEDKTLDVSSLVRLLVMFGVLWLVWGVLFYLLYRNSPDPVTQCVSWLFRGSVLELLVAVPSHVIVRRRHDCCAPGVTAFGITSGIALMLMAFGPSVLLLFKKRMKRYLQQGSGARG